MSLCDRSWVRAIASAPQFKFPKKFRKLMDAFNQASSEERRDVVGWLVSSAMDLVVDDQNFMAAFDHVERSGGAAIGRDGSRASDFSTTAKRALCRSLRDKLPCGDYMQDEVRSVSIPKRSGSRGRRTIYIQTLRDRIVNRALTQILGPLLQLSAQPFSFCRPQRGRWRAMAAADYLVEQEKRTLWITEDLQNAFDNVSRPKLAQILASRFPNEAVCKLAMEVSKTPHKQGIMQGAAVSPLLLNVYLDAMLHRPWQRSFPGTPLLRYADDLVVACQPGDDLEGPYNRLRELAASAGFKLKHGLDKAVRRLEQSEALWLGYRVRSEGGKLAVRPKRPVGCPRDDSEWRRSLLEGFYELHESPQGWMNVGSSLKAYLTQLAPCYPFVAPREICEALVNVAEEAGLDVLEPHDELIDAWGAAHERYQQIAVGTYMELVRTRQPPSCGALAGEERRPLLDSPPPVGEWESLFKYVEKQQKRRTERLRRSVASGTAQIEA